MANRAPRKCRHWGCTILTYDSDKYCKKHQRKVWRENYNEDRKERNQFYKTAAWRKLRQLKLVRSPICENDFCTQAASVVDHIQPINFYGEVREELKLDYENLQSLCASCHNVKRGKEAHTHNER